MIKLLRTILLCVAVIAATVSAPLESLGQANVVTIKTNELFARSVAVSMPWATFPLTGAFTLDLRRAATDVSPAHTFSTGVGNLRIKSSDGPTKTATLALLMSQQTAATLSGNYQGDLVYNDGVGNRVISRFVFQVIAGLTTVTPPSPPAFSNLSAWEPILDIFGGQTPTVITQQKSDATVAQGARDAAVAARDAALAAKSAFDASFDGGVLSAAKGGAGNVNGLLQANGSGLVTAAPTSGSGALLRWQAPTENTVGAFQSAMSDANSVIVAPFARKLGSGQMIDNKGVFYPVKVDINAFTDNGAGDNNNWALMAYDGLMGGPPVTGQFRALTSFHLFSKGPGGNVGVGRTDFVREASAFKVGFPSLSAGDGQLTIDHCIVRNSGPIDGTSDASCADVNIQIGEKTGFATDREGIVSVVQTSAPFAIVKAVRYQLPSINSRTGLQEYAHGLLMAAEAGSLDNAFLVRSDGTGSYPGLWANIIRNLYPCSGTPTPNFEISAPNAVVHWFTPCGFADSQLFMTNSGGKFRVSNNSDAEILGVTQAGALNTGTIKLTGTTAPSIVGGGLSAYYSATGGGVMAGSGSVCDVSILNASLQQAMCVNHGTQTVNITNEQIGNLFVFAGNTATPYSGKMYAYENSWSPPAGAWNDYFKVQIQSVAVAGGTSGIGGTRWAASQHIFSGVMTADAANGMANSHMIPFLSVATIPAGLPDGSNSTADPDYQEAGLYGGSCSVLSDGHYCEAIAAYTQDNNGVTFAKAKLVGFFAVMNKGKADNSYPYYGYQAYSNGSQQTSFGPDAAFRVDGGWRVSLDLRGNSYTSATDIFFPNNFSVTHDATNIFLNTGVSHTFNSSGISTAGGVTSASLSINNAGAAAANINAGAGSQASIYLKDGGATKWQILKQTDNSFLIYDAVGAATIFSSASGGQTAVNGATGVAFQYAGANRLTLGNTVATITTPLVPSSNNSFALGGASNLWSSIYATTLFAGDRTITSGSGAPSSTQPAGSIYMRTDGAAGSRLYVTSGGGTWAAVGGV